MGSSMRVLLALALVAAAAALAPSLENPLSEADDMLKHLEMEAGPDGGPELGEGRDVDEKKKGGDETLFRVPSTHEALDEDARLRQKDDALAKMLGSDDSIDEELLSGEHKSQRQQKPDKP